MLMAQHGLIAAATEAPVDASYLADTVVLLRFFEARGEVCIAISVIKKRTGVHERTVRELRFERGAITIGEPIKDFAGVLSGAPQLVAASGRPRAARKPRAT
jgi:circadian clock protein KaiC